MRVGGASARLWLHQLRTLVSAAVNVRHANDEYRCNWSMAMRGEHCPLGLCLKVGTDLLSYRGDGLLR